MIVQNAEVPEETGAAEGSEKPPVSVDGFIASTLIWLPMRADGGADEAEGTALPLEENSAGRRARGRRGWCG